MIEILEEKCISTNSCLKLISNICKLSQGDMPESARYRLISIADPIIGVTLANTNTSMLSQA